MASPNEIRSSTATSDLIFKGTDYSAWRSRMYNLLERKDLDDVVRPSADEEWYVENLLNVDLPRNKRQLMYAKKQAQAKGILFDHLETVYYRRVRFCTTVREALDRLDDDFFARSNIGIVQARRNMTQLTYRGQVPLVEFVNDYEIRCDAYIEAGGFLSDEDKIYQLMGALPIEFDGLVDWFEAMPEVRRRYEIFRAKLFEKGSRLQTARSLPPSNVLTGQSRSSAGSSTSKNTFNPHVLCHYCKRRGHLIRDCQTLKFKEQNRASEDGKSSSETHDTKDKNRQTDQQLKKEDTKEEKKDDWSKFKSLANKNDNSSKEPQKRLGMMVSFSSTDTCLLRQLYDSQPSVKIYPTTVSAESLVRDEEPIQLDEFEDCMLLDSGTEFHLTNDEDDLVEAYVPSTQFQVQGVDAESWLEAKKIGKMLVKFENMEGAIHEVELSHVLFVPNLAVKLMSVYRIIETDQFGVNFRRDATKIYNTTTGEIVISAPITHRLTWFRFLHVITKTLSCPATVIPPVQNAVALTEPVDQLMLWHRRLGHPSAKYLRWSVEQSEGIPRLRVPEYAFAECPTCLQAKSARLPHNADRTRPTRKFEIICSDVCDAKAVAVTGHKAFVSFIDAFSGYVEIVPIKAKTEVAPEFARFHKWVSNRFPTDPTALLRCDGAKEFTLGDCRRYCDAAGIRIDSGCPFSPELNGLAERKNRTIIEKIRSLLIDADLSVEFWSYAACTAAYLINRLPCKTNAENKSPFEIIFGRAPDISNLRVFGCIGLQHIPQQTRSREATQNRAPGLAKIGPAAKVGILFGYTPTGYQIFELDNQRVASSCDVKFLERENTTTFQQKHSTTSNDESSIHDDLNQNPSSSSSVPVIAPNLSPPHIASSSSAPAEVQEGDLFHVAARAYDTLLNEEQQEIETDDTVDFTLDPSVDVPQPLLDPTTHVIAMTAGTNHPWKRIENSLGDYVPRRYNDAVTCRFAADWKKAMEKEFQSHEENETWTIVPKSSAKNILRTMWVYTVKIDSSGNEMAKARLVAFGCADPNQYNLKETYAAVCGIDTIRLVLSIAVVHQFHMATLDVTTAFLYGKLEADVFVSVPPGLNVDRTRYTLKLNKALYGLRISPKLWHDTLKDELLKIGYLASVAERCLYYIKIDSDLAILVTYVDDLLLASNSTELLDYTLAALTDRFRVKVNRSPSSFVGLEITRNFDNNTMFISQSRYIQHLPAQFNISADPNIVTPLEVGLRVQKAETPNDDKEFRAYVGALLYVSRFSRPDIALSVHFLSTCQGWITPEIKSYAKRVMKYVINTHDLGLLYASNGEERVWSAYVDASHATDPGCRSVSGFILCHRGNITDWSTRRQELVTQSSTACEIVAVAANLDAMLVPRALYFELFNNNVPIDLFEDNTSAMFALEGCQNKRLRWVMIKAAAASEKVRDGSIYLHQVSTDCQLADIMTKLLDKTKFSRIRARLLQCPH